MPDANNLFLDHWHAQLVLLARVGFAMVLGGLVGAERELANKPAGFRTHMLVAGAACLFVGLADTLIERFSLEAAEHLRTDPIRIVEAIITGLSFIGAGTIFRRGPEDVVEGLTTAASFLLSAAVGLSVALEQHVLAVGVTLLSLFVLRIMRTLEGRMGRKRVHHKGTKAAKDEYEED